MTGQAYTDDDVVYANNKPVSATFSNGMTETWTYNSDGSSEFLSNNVEGTSYTSSANIYDPNYSSNGHLAAQETDNTNGSQTFNVHENGLTIAYGSEGATVTLPGTNDSFDFALTANTAISSGGTNENFEFNTGFGNVTISNFISESQSSTQNDTIAFANGLFANYTDLQSHMSQDKAGDTIIADTHGDSLTLTHVAMATLQAHDFLLG